MQHDIEAYNRATVDSETDMLLYNIGRLSKNEPPHFTMLSSVSQTRSFVGSAGFQWSQALAAINPITAISRAVTSVVGPTTTTTSTTGSAIGTGSTWQAGPFSAGTAESPTITFVPIQGQDFANRFETPLRDKFSYFLEDREWYATAAEKEAIVLLFAQSLVLLHGDDDKCNSGLYVNKRSDRQDLHRHETHYYSELSACVKEILERRTLNSVLIDGHHKVPTKTSEDPKAADVVTALAAGYEWNKNGDKFTLTTPVKIPAWLDYDPNTNPAEPPDPNVKPIIPYPPKSTLTPTDLLYGTPKGYTWTKDAKRNFVLVPDGYGLDQAGGLGKLGECAVDKCKSGSTCTSGKCETGICKAGNCEPGKCEADRCEPAECYSGNCDLDKTRLVYSDKIVDGVWPVPQDYFYVELRQNDDPQHLPVYNKMAEDECFNDKKSATPDNLICGYFKIGNFLQIMQRLADEACTTTDPGEAGNCPPESIFGIGTSVPAWAENSAPYRHLTGP